MIPKMVNIKRSEHLPSISRNGAQACGSSISWMVMLSTSKSLVPGLVSYGALCKVHG